MASEFTLLCKFQVVNRKNSPHGEPITPRRGVEVRTSLLSFGKPDPARPFGWLAEAPAAAPASGLSGLAQLGSSLGGLASAAEANEEIPSVPEEVDRWSAALPIYNDFEL